MAIVVPLYQGGRTIERTMRSIVEQSRPPDRLVLVDDGSSDGGMARATAMAPDATAIRHERNLGAAAAWNRAVEETDAEWVKLVCQDDVLHPDALERQVELATQAPDATVMIASRRRIIDDHDAVLAGAWGLGPLRGTVAGRDARRAFVAGGTNLFGEPAAVLFRRDVWNEVGRFDPDAAFTVDVDLWLRLLTRGPVWCDPTPVCDFRVSRRQWSARLAGRQARETRALLHDVARSDSIRWPTLASGLARNAAYAGGRRLTYLRLRYRDRRRSSRDGRGC